MDNDTDWETGQSEDIDRETDWETDIDQETDWEADWETDGPQAPARPLSPEEEYHAVGLEAMAPQAGKTPPQAPNQAPNRAKTLKTPARALHNYARQGAELDCGQAAMPQYNATDNQRFDKRFDNRPYYTLAKPGSRLVLDALLELRKEPWKLGNSFMPPRVAASSAAQKAYPGISSSAPDAPRASNPEPFRVPAQAYEPPQAPPQAHPEAPAGAHAQPSPDRPQTRPEGSSGTSGVSLTVPGTPDSTPLPPEQQYGRMYGNLESVFMADPGYAELTKNPLYADMHRMQMQHTMLNQAGMAAAFNTIAKTLEPLFEQAIQSRASEVHAYKIYHAGALRNTHPDVDELTQSGAISRWIEGLPQGVIRNTYANIVKTGTTGDVIELVNQFKRATGSASGTSDTASNDSRVLKLEAIQKSIDKSIEKWRQDALEAAKVKQARLNKRLERLAPVRSKGTRPGLGGSGHADDNDYHAGWLEAMAEMREKGEL